MIGQARARRRHPGQLVSWLLFATTLAGPAIAEPEGARTWFESARDAHLEGKVMTVDGPLAPAALGMTLMHEHLFVDWFERFPWPADPETISPEVARQVQEAGWPLPTTAEERLLFGKRDLTLADIDLLRRGARSRSNYTIDDEAQVASEIALFQAAGGRSVVDVTPIGLGRDPERLRRFSRATGLTVIMGTGWYRWPFHPAGLDSLSIDVLTERMVRDIVVGTSPGGARAGIVGEIPLDSRSIRITGPTSNAEVERRSQSARKRLLATPAAARERIPLDEIYDGAELKVLRAAARASRLTGAALSLHGNDPWIAYLSLIEREGADLHRTIIGHAHFIFRDPVLLRAALARGVVLEADYDLQQYPTRAPVGEFDPILDGVAWAIRHGHRDQVLLSQDICNKVGLRRYGGGGYVTLQNYVFPALEKRGVTQQDFDHVMKTNPARLLTFVAPRPLKD